MPVVESGKHKKVPPVVRVTAPVNFADKPTFGHFGDVNNECDDNENVHADDAWNENLKKEFQVQIQKLLMSDKHLR